MKLSRQAGEQLEATRPTQSEADLIDRLLEETSKHRVTWRPAAAGFVAEVGGFTFALDSRGTLVVSDHEGEHARVQPSSRRGRFIAGAEVEDWLDGDEANGWESRLVELLERVEADVARQAEAKRRQKVSAAISALRTLG